MLLVEDYLPAILTAHPMADEEFATLCSQHPDLFFEMTAGRRTHRKAAQVIA